MGGQEFSENFPVKFGEISGKFPVKYRVIRKREIDLVNREIKIFTKFLQKNNPQIMLSSPVKYIRNDNFDQNVNLLPTGFVYVRDINLINYNESCCRCD